MANRVKHFFNAPHSTSESVKPDDMSFDDFMWESCELFSKSMPTADLRKLSKRMIEQQMSSLGRWNLPELVLTFDAKGDERVKIVPYSIYSVNKQSLPVGYADLFALNVLVSNPKLVSGNAQKTAAYKEAIKENFHRVVSTVKQTDSFIVWRMFFEENLLPDMDRIFGLFFDNGNEDNDVVSTACVFEPVFKELLKIKALVYVGKYED